MKIFRLQNNLSERCESAGGCREWRVPRYPGSPGRRGERRARPHNPDIIVIFLPGKYFSKLPTRNMISKIERHFKIFEKAGFKSKCLLENTKRQRTFPGIVVLITPS